MGMVGVDCGPVRRPIEPATPEQVDQLRRELDQGIGQYIGEQQVEGLIGQLLG